MPFKRGSGDEVAVSVTSAIEEEPEQSDLTPGHSQADEISDSPSPSTDPLGQQPDPDNLRNWKLTRDRTKRTSKPPAKPSTQVQNFYSMLC